MNYETWRPVYEQILDDFGFGREADEEARDELADLTRPIAAASEFDLTRLDVSGEVVAIAGAGPSLTDPDHPDRPVQLDRARDADAVFAASTAVDELRQASVGVDCMVTDLDKNPATARELTEEDTPVASHAHGDNINMVCKWIPRFDRANVLPTTQARPVGHVRNFGGFTDGDRAAFLADHLGARTLVFVGWDFEDPDVDPMKARKLEWAERLLRWLEVRRGEEFGVLDGRRGAIDVSEFPD
ncbi:6-hydroxymethylpterin diphosphokinase MptE-like protein [Halorussus lipolyticus]|uniref:6-hydroxymethylpterin diphosphokinase MptE-like protein n=1 Tax=Halorussus lipolyticus TaxID=3034024 RepID=UPI0023E7576B|nr:6-hydroxymethylpterin diphosphokinase MptE-like protein [Halorussus sp. DT80]